MPPAMPLFPNLRPGRRLTVRLRSCLAMGLVVAGMGSAAAQPEGAAPTASLYIQAGAAREDTQAWIVGTTVPWKHWTMAWVGGTVRGHWDLHLGQWAADGTRGRVHSSLLGAGAAWQWRPGQGLSPWFVEAGTGLNYAKPRFATTTKTMGSRLNFASHLAVGYLWGAQQAHEWQLRVQHSSNGGLKKPNPGQNFVQLRYARHF